MRSVFAFVLLGSCALVAAKPQPQWQVELAQIMGNPDWIGPPVEQPYWALDGKSLGFNLKREGSSLRDAWQVSSDGRSAAERVDDSRLATLDAPGAVVNGGASKAVFIRNGDVFLRDLGSGRLRQVTRSTDEEALPGFLADGSGIYWRSANQWFVERFDDALMRPLAAIRTERDPAAKPEPDLLRQHQLRLSSTLARERADRELVAARDKALRAQDGSRAPDALYLGDKVVLLDSRLSPDGHRILLVTAAKDANAGQVGKMPKYVTESGYEEVEDVRTRVGRNWPLGQTLWLADLETGAATQVDVTALPGIEDDPLAKLRKAQKLDPLKGARPLRIDGIAWHPRGDRVLVQARATDNKDRWLAEVELSTAQLKPRHRISDAAWVNDGGSDNSTYNAFGWRPGSRDIWFLSEQSGHSHLYLLDDRRKPRELTSGRWEATRPVWTRDGARVFISCNRAGPGDYEVCIVDAKSGAVREISALDAVEDFWLSPDESQVGVLYSGSFLPPQLAVIDADGRTRVLTDTRTAAYKAQQLLAPRFVEVPSRHGAGVIHGKFYRPDNLEAGRRYPLVLFVHGAGYLQNVHHGWPAYFREQMFHGLLVRSGYLVLDLDYRGSAGYGRDWRTAIYRQMGHPELEDYVDGVNWLVDTQQGDRARVGIYGGSYGGFMTFMALFREPEIFKAGAALRPVTDWTSYNHEYTANILNSPELDPESYRKSSPIEFAEGLQGQLLIAHGMIDDNVFFQDSVRLAQRLIELRKEGWELASYPLERHGFVHPEAWYDEYRRIYELFARTLK